MGNGRVAVVVLRDGSRERAVDQLTEHLRASGAFTVSVAGDPEQLRHLGQAHAVYVDWSTGVLDGDQERHLADFVRGGGILITAGGTLAAWASNRSIADLAAWSPDGRTVPTELVVETAGEASHLADGGFRIHDRFHLLSALPEGATPLLRAHWHHAEHIVAYTRVVGSGRFTYIGLGHDAGAYANPDFRRLVARSLRPAEPGSGALQEVGIGLLGFGALGRAHVAAIERVPGLAVARVCDRAPQRRDEAAAMGIETAATPAELFAADGVDVVLVGTPPADHVDSVLAALDGGKHVVCEKPFALYAADCDRMIERARSVERVVTVFQNRRWDPDFLAVQRAVRGGRVGELFYMESFVGRFAHPCHLWHSHQPISGGAVYDWGSHYIDWTLQLIDDTVVAVRSVAQKRVWHDVTNADHVSVEMQFDNGAQALFLQSDIAAAAKPKWYVLGTSGAVIGDWQITTERSRGPDGEIDEHRVSPTDLPARIRVLRPDGDHGSHEDTLALPQRDRLAFYRNLAAHFRDGEPLAVPPQQARRTVAVMEAATSSAARNGALITTRI